MKQIVQTDPNTIDASAAEEELFVAGRDYDGRPCIFAARSFRSKDKVWIVARDIGVSNAYTGGNKGERVVSWLEHTKRTGYVFDSASEMYAWIAEEQRKYEDRSGCK